MTSPTETLHRRVRLMRERELIRAWEYRQRNYSKGVWHRLRRVLVDASEAWALDERDTGRLAASAGWSNSPSAPSCTRPSASSSSVRRS